LLSEDGHTLPLRRRAILAFSLTIVLLLEVMRVVGFAEICSKATATVCPHRRTHTQKYLSAVKLATSFELSINHHNHHTANLCAASTAVVSPIRTRHSSADIATPVHDRFAMINDGDE
jgi:hypothetical protein